MYKTFSLLQLVILHLMASTIVDSLEDEYICYETLCHPENYDPNEIPEGIKVHTNFLQAEDALKQVDDHEMVITFEPHIVMVWKDPRLRLRLNISQEDGTELPDAMLNKIWTPKLTVEHLTSKNDQDPDPGKVGKL